MTDLDRAAAMLRAARRVLFVTGAGVSAASGLPTYRGIGGLYAVADTPDGLPIEAVLSGRMLRADPALCWKYIAQIEAACRGARHNAAHDAIAALERDREVVVLTQNVDGLHRDAGSTRVIEIHGTLRRLVCVACGRDETRRDYAGLAVPPRCPACGGLVRPDVVLFGEMLPGPALAALRDEARRGFDVVFSVGTTSAFPYVAAPVLEARARGVPTVEINPGDSEVSHLVDVRLRMGAVEALRALTA